MKKDDGRAMTGVQIVLTDSVRMNGMMADLHGLPCAVRREKDLTIELHRDAAERDLAGGQDRGYNDPRHGYRRSCAAIRPCRSEAAAGCPNGKGAQRSGKESPSVIDRIPSREMRHFIQKAFDHEDVVRGTNTAPPWSRLLRARVIGAIHILFGASTFPSLTGSNNVGMSLPSSSELNDIPLFPSCTFGRRFGWT
jgi:hypothetical protein